jgi:hypothetical protein
VLPAPAESTAMRSPFLTISFEVHTNDVLWSCPRCGDEGRIAGWEGTFWDNTVLESEDLPESQRL